MHAGVGADKGGCDEEDCWKACSEFEMKSESRDGPGPVIHQNHLSSDFGNCVDRHLLASRGQGSRREAGLDLWNAQERCTRGC